MVQISLDKNNVLEIISNELSLIKSIRLVYVYGSFILRNDFHDIDVAVLFNSNVMGEDLFYKKAMELGRLLEKKFNYKFEFDVRPLNNSSIEFQYEVIKNGKLIYAESDDLRQEYEFNILSEYLEYSEMYKMFDQALLKRAIH
ncbi:MAG: nucleotidyltransferase domain-containing protein [Candidatus Odinarchaeota archaeon]